MIDSEFRELQAYRPKRVLTISSAFSRIAVRAFALLIAVFAAVGLSDKQDTHWRNLLIKAEAAFTAGDHTAARSLYLQAARNAVWNDDWSGVLAAACGMREFESLRSNFFATRPMLLRAMIMAEKQNNPSGLRAVAEVFASIGDHNASAMVLKRLPGYSDRVQATNSPSPCA